MERGERRVYLIAHTIIYNWASSSKTKQGLQVNAQYSFAQDNPGIIWI
jgi:hypothetical protein